MFLNEALELLKEGKAVKRAIWGDVDGYLVFLSGMKHVWKILTNPNPNAGNHIFSVEELCADDWELHSHECNVQQCNEPCEPDATVTL